MFTCASAIKLSEITMVTAIFAKCVAIIKLWLFGISLPQSSTVATVMSTQVIVF